MNEVDKMYENSGIEPTHYDACALEDKYWNNEELANQYGTLDRYLSFECPYYGEGCYSTCEYAYDKDEYPPFTAEKQIELIKWLGKLAGKLEICSNYNDTQYLLYFYLNRKTRDEILPNISSGRSENFEESLASLINNLWQSLTEEECKQIKEILE